MTSSSARRRPALVRLKPEGTSAAVVVALAATVVTLQVVRDRAFPPPAAPEQFLYVSSPAVVSRMALAYDALAADVYWIRLVLYYGSTRLSEEPDKRYDLLYPLLDLTTSLDPHFSIAYRFGAFFLSEPPPGGAGRPELAQALLEKGMAADPARWEYPHDVGFVYYREGDYTRAAEWFRRAAMVPGAPNWLEPVAAVTLAAGGDVTAARTLWRNLLLSAEEEWIRRAAEYRLQQLDTIEAIARLQQVVDLYAERRGAPPDDWTDLVQAGLLRAVPADPAGLPFVIQHEAGRARVVIDRESPLAPLPTARTP